MPAESLSPWPTLLRELDSIAPAIGVWKNADEALHGKGDVDYFAPRECWPDIAAAFQSWAETSGFDSLPPCLHRPWTMYLLAVDRQGGRLMQLDVRDRLTLGGSEIIDAGGLGSLLEETRHGFKVLRPGAEATLKLLLKCIDHRGLRAGCVHEESVHAGITADLDGAHMTVRQLRHGGTEANRLVNSVVSGHADVDAARSLMGAARTRAILRPGTLAAVAAYRLRKQWCPTLRWILAHGQDLPPDLDDWNGDVRRVHSLPGMGLVDETVRRAAGREQGRYLVLAGPDGVGKTTLRNALTETLGADHRLWSGRLSGPLTEFRQSRAPTQPGHSLGGRGWMSSRIKVLYLYLDAVLRWLTWTRPWLKRGGWVITERGWWDIAVYPARYRMGSVGRLHEALGMLGPRPDLIIVLEAGADTVHARKDELSTEELQRQMQAWRTVIPTRQPHVYLDATLPPGTLAVRALAAIDEASAGRVAVSTSL